MMLPTKLVIVAIPLNRVGISIQCTEYNYSLFIIVAIPLNRVGISIITLASEQTLYNRLSQSP